MNGVIPYCVIWDRLDPLFFTKGWLKPDRTYEAATEACLKTTNCNHVSISQIVLVLDPVNEMLLFNKDTIYIHDKHRKYAWYK